MSKKGVVLLLNDSEESRLAEKELKEHNINYQILLETSVWEDIKFPIPTLFYRGIKTYKGIEEIRDLIDELTS